MDTDVAQDKELGRELARVRELAELTQADLAARRGMSQSVVSRIESGERRLENAEFHEFAEAIGTEEARGMETRRSREWSELRRPPLGHPDHDLLWMAEVELRQLQTLLGPARHCAGVCTTNRRLVPRDRNRGRGASEA